MSNARFLQKSAEWYTSQDGLNKDWGDFHKQLMNYRFQTIGKWLKGKKCLEFGTADGESTQHLLPLCDKVVSIEGAGHFVEQVKKRFQHEVASGKLKVIHSLFEKYSTKDRFDIALAALILEHLEQPSRFLMRARSFLKSNGLLIIIVPNAQSLHRLAAVKMGQLKKPHSLNQQDILLGHKRVYYPKKLMADIEKAGLEAVYHGGIFLKPLSNKQIQKGWTQAMMDGFYELGKDFPDFAAELFVVCKARK